MKKDFFFKLKKVLGFILRPSIIKIFARIGSGGYLNDTGWIKSFEKKTSIDSEGKPLPWVSYAYIYFIQNRLKGYMNIFEFGSGNSTLYYASKVHSVTSVEHDRLWFDNLSVCLPDNIRLSYQPLSENDNAYAKFPVTDKQKYHIVIVDGRDRVMCLEQSSKVLTEDGVIVLDDSHRQSYQAGVDYLIQQQFKKLDFWGIAPGIFYHKCTSIFYKKNNCLGI